mmetsp:Transcript_32720/g.48453  ORF Transcript_32720/g.48453 Transcript_32720/m.48453 type:complete len:586 (-) Transcript_32720:287-2044(-)|eukprot:CAMPEP_0194215736 /NCGR_PEP_ID=MMETSP0156-20130528/17750_1 /TAXON_ID=33649 /ORGANISM="Thalassionema nitzschioides, Strain L26-B" /LENGTH=585 /DNA_ID=CAMNT_0038944335 /DNA_START=197 /DNA_END=1954 /DNA_ORIENTATION=-
MRYDLAFFLCCCKSFFGSDDVTEGNDFYSLLGVEHDASQDDIKKAYKKKSLSMHPDKLAQRGKVATEEDQARFTRMKEAYEVLSDKHKRETYDAIGERGMKWLEEPFSLDPQELAHNFATSSVIDRSKIFAIFVGIAVAVFLLPFVVCLQVDGEFGEGASWMAVLFPLWIWDVIILFYHARVIMMGPITRPDHIPLEDWVDPLPMKKRIFSLARFVLIVLFEILAALKLDETLNWNWSAIFIPLYAWEATTLYKKLPLARMRIVTVEDLEAALGKPFAQFTAAEKDLIGKRYSVVPSATSPEFEAAQKLKLRARHDMIKSGFRIVFVLLLLIQLDGYVEWNWWLIFTPFWFMTGLFCYANYQAFTEVQQMAAEKDPTLFGLKKDDPQATTGYGAMEKDGTTPQQKQELTEEEREELKAQVMASSSRLCSKCCSQGFLLIIVMLFVAKIQGGNFSAIWIMSPILFVAGMILCIIGCAIFGITEVPTDGVEFDTAQGDSDVESPASQYTAPTSQSTNPPIVITTSATPASQISPPDLLDDSPRASAPIPESTTGQKTAISQNTTVSIGESDRPEVAPPSASEVGDLD